MIRGYPRCPSVLPGGELVLHVSSSARRFRVRFYRWADGLEFMHETARLPGKAVADGSPDQDWNWPSHAFDVPLAWPSGVYIAHLVDDDSSVLSLAADRAAVLFIVRGQGESRLLYKLPVATYHAYNCSGGGCFYHRPPRSIDPPGSRVSLLRPGGGIGGETHGAADYYDQTSVRQTFAHWDAPFIRWLSRHGCQPDLCTDLDVHADPRLLQSYKLLLSVGHDEYWTEAMRNAVEHYVAGGGNVAFFGANVCWWRVHLRESMTTMVCHQGGPQGALDHWWPQCGVGRPEDSLTGVSYRHGGGHWDGPRETRGYLVQKPKHWAFAGTGLTAGTAFGATTTPPLVGYECDGVPLTWIDEGLGLACLTPDACATGTPPGFEVLAVGPLTAAWQELPPRETGPAGSGLRAATLGCFERNGCVFTVGSTDWAQVLVSGQDARVGRITLNVIERLSGSAVGACQRNGVA